MFDLFTLMCCIIVGALLGNLIYNLIETYDSLKDNIQQFIRDVDIKFNYNRIKIDRGVEILPSFRWFAEEDIFLKNGWKTHYKANKIDEVYKHKRTGKEILINSNHIKIENSECYASGSKIR